MPKRLGGGYCRLQTPLRPALGVRGTVAGHRLGALEGMGYPPPFPMHPLGWNPNMIRPDPARHGTARQGRAGQGRYSGQLRLLSGEKGGLKVTVIHGQQLAHRTDGDCNQRLSVECHVLSGDSTWGLSLACCRPRAQMRGQGVRGKGQGWG